jgi:hypothetical protein
MPVAEQYRVLNRFQWMGTWYDRGDAISRDAILAAGEVGMSKLGSLQRTRFIDMDPVTRPLSKLTVDELIEHGREVGAEVKRGMTKRDLVTAIEEAPYG